MDIRSQMLDVILELSPELMKEQDGMEFFSYLQMPDNVLKNTNQSFKSLAKKTDVVCIISRTPDTPGRKGIMFTKTGVVISVTSDEEIGAYCHSYENWKELSISGNTDKKINVLVLKLMMRRLYDIRASYLDESDTEDDEADNSGEGEEFDYLSYFTHMDDLNYQFMKRERQADGDDIILFALDNLYDFRYDFIKCLKYADDLDSGKNGVSIRSGNECIFDFWEKVGSAGERYCAKARDNEVCRDHFLRWIEFWGMLFYDHDTFRKIYPIDMLRSIPDGITKIVMISDEIAQDKTNGQYHFIEMLDHFAQNGLFLIDSAKKLPFKKDLTDYQYRFMLGVKIDEGEMQVTWLLKRLLYFYTLKG